MAVLKAIDFFELLTKLAVSDNSNFIKDENSISTFSELARESIANAKKIFANFGTGKRFFISADHSVFFVEAFLSVAASGNIAIPVNPSLPTEQLKDLAHKFKIDYIIEDHYPQMKKIFKIPELSGDNGAMALLTSGSTGDSKAVVLSHLNILANAASVIESMNIENPGTVALMLPLYHSFALVTQMVTTLLTGGQILMVPDFELPGELIKFIIQNQINTIAGVPTSFKLLLMGNTLKFEHLKHITIAGAALDAALSVEIKKAFPNASLWVGYGLTEAGPRVTAISDNQPEFVHGSVGKPIKGVELKIIDDEVLVKSPSIMVKYLDDKKTTAKKIIDGWLHTGDLGRLDENGHLYITGRKDDIFISGGEKISPLAIERILNKHPDIFSSAVSGENDPIMGSRIIALLQLRESKKIKIRDVIEHCQKHLEHHLVPHKFFKVNALPLTPNGKLKRKELPLCQKEKI